MAENEFSPNESAYMIGHVEYTVRGADGQVKQYAQGDNDIVKRGKDCAAQMIFNSSAITTACPITSGTTGFNFIAIGNATGAIDGTETQLDIGTNTREIARNPGKVSFETSGSSTIATITTKDPFVFTSIGSTSVEQSGLFDKGDAATGNMFAMRNALAIPVTSADTLSVTWKVTLGSTP
jgi:hypothetical protein